MEKKRFLGGCSNRLCVVSRLLCFFCLFIGIYACQVDEGKMEREGVLAFRMEVDTTLSSPATKALAWKDFEDANSYAVTILRDTGVVAEYSRFDKMPAQVKLPEGAYTVRASKGKDLTADFETPYFCGEKDFTIVKEMTTPVEVSVAMANSRVTVDFTDDFLQTYKDYKLYFNTNKTPLPLAFAKGETRPMYFKCDAGGTKLTIAMELVNVYGKPVNYTATTTIKPKQWSKLTVRTDEKGLNGIAIDVTLNDQTKETIYVNIGIPDFMEKLKGAPYVACSLFKWDNTNISTEEPTEYNKNTSSAKVMLISGGKIKNVFLTLKDESTVLIDQYDLANLTDVQAKDLADNYGFTAPEGLNGSIQKEFEMKTLIASLAGKAEESAYELSLTVKDALPVPNQTTKTVKIIVPAAKVPSVGWGFFPNNKSFEQGTLKLTLGVSDAAVAVEAQAGIKKVTISIDGIGITDHDLYTLDVPGISITETSPIKISMKYNVANWFNKLSFNDDGTAKKYTTTYKVTDMLDRTVEASRSFTVTPPPFEWIGEPNVFAKRAVFQIDTKERDKVQFTLNGESVSFDNVEWTTDKEFVLKGLEGSNEYTLVAKYEGLLIDKTFTTETIEYLPNSNFEEWTVGPNGVAGHGDYESAGGILNPNYKYTHTPYRSWERWYPYTSTGSGHWDTLNEYTTSLGRETQTFAKIGTGDKLWTRYGANSGTIRSNDHNTGSYSALIRTVGWGKDNTAAGTSVGECKNITTGELYLGSYNVGSVQYGMPFTSRPQALSFFYKYKTNTRKFVAEVHLYNGDEEIASGTISENEAIATDTWTKRVVAITYKTGKETLKATSISVVFKSSSTQEEKGSLLSYPPFGNLSDGEYVGSQLYIDDVELIYDYSE